VRRWVGWPGDEREEFGNAPQWNALAEKWYWWADDAGLWVTAHDASTVSSSIAGYYMPVRSPGPAL
jgi:hypothetical protein